jgi:hypothetical protein
MDQHYSGHRFNPDYDGCVDCGIGYGGAPFVSCPDRLKRAARRERWVVVVVCLVLSACWLLTMLALKS